MEKFKVNREKKTFVFEDGEELPIPKDKVREVLRSKSAKQLKEKTKGELKREVEGSFAPSLEAFRQQFKGSLLGDLGGQVGDYIASAFGGLSKGEGQEEMGYVDRILDNFYARQDAQKEHLAELSQSHPTASMIGKGVGIAGEIVALGRLPGALAMPLIGAAHSDTSFLEPQEKGSELARDAIVGTLLDKFLGAASKIARERGAIRSNMNPLPSQYTPQGVLGRLASGLESLGIGQVANAAKSSVPAGILAKLAGLPVGKAAAGMGASFVGLKGLTSPSAAGEFARQAIKQGGLATKAVLARAEKYPSYHDGIVKNPMERRSLTKEIEQDYSIPLEQKALLQSKVNRGIPLFDRLE